MRQSDKIKSDVISGSHDQQIYSGGHDEIVMWLYGKLKNESFLKKVFGIPENFIITKVNIEIESPLKSMREAVIGFADLAVFIQYKRPASDNSKNNYINNLKEEIKKKNDDLERTKYQYEKTNNGYYLTKYEGIQSQIDGFNEKLNDALENGLFHDDVYARFVEVKTKVGIGETIRQIKYYDNMMPKYANTLWFVCAPLFTHYAALAEQNIGFIPNDEEHFEDYLLVP